jgi:peroxiredoxin
MKIKILLLLAIAPVFLLNRTAAAADTNGVKAELKPLVDKINEKLEKEGTKENDLTNEFKAFDDLNAKHKAEKTDDAAQIPYMKMMLYMHFDDTAKALTEINQIKKDFPDTKVGQSADKIIASINQQEASKKIQAGLVEGKPFPAFEEKDMTGKMISLAGYKGKVVLVTFWATSCVPCVAELPNVLKTYEKHHGEGFEIIGISLDEDQAKVTAFTKEKNIPWQQYFDGKGWENKLAEKYGITAIPATYLLDGSGTIIGKDLRGEELEAAVTKALAKK